MHTLLSVLATSAFVVATVWLNRALFIETWKHWRG